MQPAGAGEAGCRAAWDAIERDGDQDLLGFGTVADGQWLLARLRSDSAMDRLAPNQSADWRSLGVSVLHVLVLDELLERRWATASCRYVHSIGEVLADVAARGCDLACLVPPAADEPRREHRVQPRNHASQEHLFLSQAPHRAGAQPAFAAWTDGPEAASISRHESYATRSNAVYWTTWFKVARNI